MTILNTGLGNPDDVANEFGRSPLYFKLGYFSLIGLLRTHVLLGDYHQALKTVENLELDPKVKFVLLAPWLSMIVMHITWADILARPHSIR